MATSSSASTWMPPRPITSAGTTASVRTETRSSTPGVAISSMSWARRATAVGRGVCRYATAAAEPANASRTPVSSRTSRAMRADRGLVPHVGRRDLQRHRPRELVERRHRLVLIQCKQSAHDGHAARTEQRLRLVLREPAPAAARRDPATPRRSRADASRQRRGQRSGHGHAGPQPGDRRHAGVDEPPGGLVVEQLRQRRRDHHRHRATRRRRRGCPPRPRPSSRRVAGDARAGGRRRPARGRSPGPRRRRGRGRAASRPRPRSSPCSRAGWRPSPRRAAARAAPRPSPARAPAASTPRRTASSAPRPESPPEHVRIARPPPGRGRAPRTASALASSSRSWTSAAHAAPASSTSARNTRWSPATAPVCAAAAAAPRGRGADLEHRDADALVGAHGERLAQPRAVAVGLDEQRDRAHAAVAREVLDPVRRRDHRLVAARDRRVQPQPAPRGERVDHEVAALGDERDVAGLAAPPARRPTAPPASGARSARRSSARRPAATTASPPRAARASSGTPSGVSPNPAP